MDVFKNVVLIVMYYETVADDLCALAMAYVLLDCGVFTITTNIAHLFEHKLDIKHQTYDNLIGHEWLCSLGKVFYYFLKQIGDI